jgi:hypothetical protein
LLLSHGMMLQMCFVMLHTLGSITFLMWTFHQNT